MSIPAPAWGSWLSGCPPLQVGQYRPFADTLDEGLQSALERALDKNRSWHALIEQNKMAVGVVDLSNPAAARFASVNGWTMMYAASLPKIAVLLAAYQSIEDGLLQEMPDLHEWLVRMIRRSNNYAASYMIDLIGLKRIEDLLQRYQFYVPEYGGGIWLVPGMPRRRAKSRTIKRPDTCRNRYAIMPLLLHACNRGNDQLRDARARCWRYFQGRAFTTNL